MLRVEEGVKSASEATVDPIDAASALAPAAAVTAAAAPAVAVAAAPPLPPPSAVFRSQWATPKV